MGVPTAIRPIVPARLADGCTGQKLPIRTSAGVSGHSSAAGLGLWMSMLFHRDQSEMVGLSSYPGGTVRVKGQT